MKSGTPKTDALIKYYDQIKLTKYWSIKRFSKAFDELVMCLLPRSWVNPLESLKDTFEENDNAATGACKTNHFVSNKS